MIQSRRLTLQRNLVILLRFKGRPRSTPLRLQHPMHRHKTRLPRLALQSRFSRVSGLKAPQPPLPATGPYPLALPLISSRRSKRATNRPSATRPKRRCANGALTGAGSRRTRRRRVATRRLMARCDDRPKRGPKSRGRAMLRFALPSSSGERPTPPTEHASFLQTFHRSLLISRAEAKPELQVYRRSSESEAHPVHPSETRRLGQRRPALTG